MWTPDSARIGFAHRRENAVYWQKTDGSGLQQLVQSRFGSWIGSWTSDMRTLVYMHEDPETRTDLWAADLLNKSAPRPIVRTKAREYGGRVSPDGQWVAYFSDERQFDQFALYVRPLSGGPAHQVAGAGAREAVWTRNGRELLFRNGRQVLSFEMPTNGDLASGRPVVLLEGDYFSTGGPGIVNFDVSPDGERLLMLKAVEQGRTPNLTVVQDVKGLIRDRLPLPDR
jgi:Tol biopolymer transport system component